MIVFLGLHLFENYLIKKNIHAHSLTEHSQKLVLYSQIVMFLVLFKRIEIVREKNSENGIKIT